MKRKNGWFLLLILLCAAFLVSCAKRTDTETERGELVQWETGEDSGLLLVHF